MYANRRRAEGGVSALAGFALNSSSNSPVEPNETNNNNNNNMNSYPRRGISNQEEKNEAITAASAARVPTSPLSPYIQYNSNNKNNPNRNPLSGNDEPIAEIELDTNQAYRQHQLLPPTTTSFYPNHRPSYHDPNSHALVRGGFISSSSPPPPPPPPPSVNINVDQMVRLVFDLQSTLTSEIHARKQLDRHIQDLQQSLHSSHSSQHHLLSRIKELEVERKFENRLDRFSDKFDNRLRSNNEIDSGRIQSVLSDFAVRMERMEQRQMNERMKLEDEWKSNASGIKETTMEEIQRWNDVITAKLQSIEANQASVTHTNRSTQEVLTRANERIVSLEKELSVSLVTLQQHQSQTQSLHQQLQQQQQSFHQQHQSLHQQLQSFQQTQQSLIQSTAATAATVQAAADAAADGGPNSANTELLRLYLAEQLASQSKQLEIRFNDLSLMVNETRQREGIAEQKMRGEIETIRAQMDAVVVEEQNRRDQMNKRLTKTIKHAVTTTLETVKETVYDTEKKMKNTEEMTAEAYKSLHHSIDRVERRETEVEKIVKEEVEIRMKGYNKIKKFMEEMRLLNMKNNKNMNGEKEEEIEKQMQGLVERIKKQEEKLGKQEEKMGKIENEWSKEQEKRMVELKRELQNNINHIMDELTASKSSSSSLLTDQLSQTKSSLHSHLDLQLQALKSQIQSKFNDDLQHQQTVNQTYTINEITRMKSDLIHSIERDTLESIKTQVKALTEELYQNKSHLTSQVHQLSGNNTTNADKILQQLTSLQASLTSLQTQFDSLSSSHSSLQQDITAAHSQFSLESVNRFEEIENEVIHMKDLNLNLCEKIDLEFGKVKEEMETREKGREERGNKEWEEKQMWMEEKMEEWKGALGLVDETNKRRCEELNFIITNAFEMLNQQEKQLREEEAEQAQMMHIAFETKAVLDDLVAGIVENEQALQSTNPALVNGGLAQEQFNSFKQALHIELRTIDDRLLEFEQKLLDFSVASHSQQQTNQGQYEKLETILMELVQQFAEEKQERKELQGKVEEEKKDQESLQGKLQTFSSRLNEINDNHSHSLLELNKRNELKQLEMETSLHRKLMEHVTTLSSSSSTSNNNNTNLADLLQRCNKNETNLTHLNDIVENQLLMNSKKMNNEMKELKEEVKENEMKWDKKLGKEREEREGKEKEWDKKWNKLDDNLNEFDRKITNLVRPPTSSPSPASPPPSSSSLSPSHADVIRDVKDVSASLKLVESHMQEQEKMQEKRMGELELRWGGRVKELGERVESSEERVKKLGLSIEEAEERWKKDKREVEDKLYEVQYMTKYAIDQGFSKGLDLNAPVVASHPSVPNVPASASSSSSHHDSSV